MIYAEKTDVLGVCGPPSRGHHLGSPSYSRRLLVSLCLSLSKIMGKSIFPLSVAELLVRLAAQWLATFTQRVPTFQTTLCLSFVYAPLTSNLSAKQHSFAGNWQEAAGSQVLCLVLEEGKRHPPPRQDSASGLY